MQSTYIYEGIKILSDVPIKRTENDIVYFEDGSVADLSSLVVRNTGKGTIRFKHLPLFELPLPLDTKCNIFDSIEHLSINSQNEQCYFEIVQTEDETSIEITGSEDFLKNVSMETINNKVYLNIMGQQSTDFVMGQSVVYVNGKRKQERVDIEGKIIIKIRNYLPSLFIRTNYEGYGFVNCPVDSLSLELQGASSYEFATINSLNVQINGSSSIDIEQIRESANININGSGAVHIHSGETKHFESTINGSGNISANISSEKAKLILQGSGSIALAHVVDESVEAYRGSGTIHVLKRGV